MDQLSQVMRASSCSDEGSEVLATRLQDLLTQFRNLEASTLLEVNGAGPDPLGAARSRIETRSHRYGLLRLIGELIVEADAAGLLSELLELPEAHPAPTTAEVAAESPQPVEEKREVEEKLNVAPTPALTTPVSTVVVPEKPAAVSPRANLSDDKIAQFKAKMEGRDSGENGPAITLNSQPIADLSREWQRVGPILNDFEKLELSCMPVPSHAERTQAWAEFLDRTLPSLSSLPQEIHRDLLEWLVSELLALQHDEGKTGSQSAYSRLFGKISRHHRDNECKFVHGLAQSHRPRNGSWKQDAETARAEIRRLALEEAVKSQSKKKRGRRASKNVDDEIRILRGRVHGENGGCGAQTFAKEACRLINDFDLGFKYRPLVGLGAHFGPDLLRTWVPKDFYKAVMATWESRNPEEVARALAEQEQDVPVLDPEWAFIHLTRGKRLLLVGGEPRKERYEPLRQAFEAEKLEWITNSKKGVRIAAGAVQQVQNSQWDVVVVIRRLVSHTLADMFFAEKKGDALIVLSEGYGATSIRQAIARYGSAEALA